MRLIMGSKDNVALITNLLVLAGCLVIIVILLWGLVHITGLAISWVSSLFDREPVARVEVLKETNIEEAPAATNTEIAKPLWPDLSVRILRVGIIDAYGIF